MSYEKYYPGGWQSGESGGTPITPEALNHIENGIKQTHSEFLPLSGGTMTGTLDMGGNNFGNFSNINGIKMRGFRFDTNTTCNLSIGTNRWGCLVCLTSPGGASVLYYLAGQDGSQINRTHKLFGDDGMTPGFSIKSNGVLTMSCGTNWSTGWYIANADFAQMIQG